MTWLVIKWFLLAPVSMETTTRGRGTLAPMHGRHISAESHGFGVMPATASTCACAVSKWIPISTELSVTETKILEITQAFLAPAGGTPSKASPTRLSHGNSCSCGTTTSSSGTSACE